MKYRMYIFQIFTIILLFILAIFIPRIIVYKDDFSSKNWDVVFCDVGQGDGAVIKTSDRNALVVDVGPNSKKMLSCLRELDILVIEILVLTHFHMDHIGGIKHVVDNFTIKEIQISPVKEPKNNAEEILKYLYRKNIKVSLSNVGELKNIGNISWQTIWPEKDLANFPKDLLSANNSSVVIRVQVKERDFIFLGDLEIEAQRKLLDNLTNNKTFLSNNGFAVKGPIVKVAHHGSAKQLDGMYSYFNPSVGIISAGEGNSYGHPSKKILDIFKDIPVYRTDKNGRIVITILDNNINIETEK